MNTVDKTNDIDLWIGPPQPGEVPESGYEEWLKAELEAAAKEIDEGKGIPIEEIRKEFNLE